MLLAVLVVSCITVFIFITVVLLYHYDPPLFSRVKTTRETCTNNIPRYCMAGSAHGQDQASLGP